jgi:predicted phosphodiesterase
MLIGVLSDAHGNPLGLCTTLDALALAGVQRLYFLGDAVGYMPGEEAVLAALTAAGATCQQGNHEAMLLGELDLDPERDRVYGLGPARDRMDPASLALIASWPRSREVSVDGRRLLFVHGAPDDPLRGYVYPDSALDGYESLGYDAIVMGNTHRPFVTERAGVLIANAGSCGMPRDQGNLPSCLVYDTSRHTAQVLRAPVSPASVLGQFDAVHPDVRDCLHRIDPNAFGNIVEHL